MSQGSGKMRIGDALVQEGLLSNEELNRALAHQKASGRMLGELLVEQGVGEVGRRAQRGGVLGESGKVGVGVGVFAPEQAAERVHVAHVPEHHSVRCVAVDLGPGSA